MRFAALLLPIVFLGTDPPPRAVGFTIAQVLSSPFPTELTAAPAGRPGAWISNHEGRRNFHPEYDPLRRPDTAAKAWASSPLSSIDRWRVVRGDDNRNVPFSETLSLVAGLRARGVEVEQLVLPNEVHSFLRHESWGRVYTATAELLERKLSTGPIGRTHGEP